ncbi:hydroxysteroid dehydrogenase-like protein 2 [Saccoglossus kowalevskii]|uniref:Hydroxysteroid dehydrogenase-like protein 2-like n=1 Tax=Saccoglossus kowalevskii TaxID=10224 RepID=A0ABM0GM73_SACKO|nr:PREDICTED: hydroxysteroid dehydrogenase-like protein 2-like [Saccoglossus kowalevskii]
MLNALVVGASRGIGRQIAITLAKNGYQVGVAAKTTEESAKLPGTIHSVVNEIQATGGHAIPIVCNVRHEQDIKEAVDTCIKQFGKLDYVIYNAGAITWKKVMDTPLKKFDLMHQVNPRGAYCLVQELLPLFLKQGSGKILLVAPPIYSRFFKGKTPYSMGKVGMTVLVHGLANELKGTGVSITALWPATVIESQVTVMQGVPSSVMRKADIFADACLHIGNEKTDRLNGQALIDEDYLRSIGVTDFTPYRCDLAVEPPRMMPRAFPSLKVTEENEQLHIIHDPKSKL